jgi:hypothetical protein
MEKGIDGWTNPAANLGIIEAKIRITLEEIQGG